MRTQGAHGGATHLRTMERSGSASRNGLMYRKEPRGWAETLHFPRILLGRIS